MGSGFRLPQRGYPSPSGLPGPGKRAGVFQGAATFECRRGYPDPEVAPSVLRPGVAFVEMALVDDFEGCGIQSVGEALPNGLDAGFTHGSTSLNGLTVTLAYTPAST